MTLSQDVEIASVVCGVASFGCFLAAELVTRRKPELRKLIERMFTASTIPTSLALIYCAVDPSALTKLQGISIYIAVAGVATLFVAVEGLTPRSS